MRAYICTFLFKLWSFTELTKQISSKVSCLAIFVYHFVSLVVISSSSSAGIRTLDRVVRMCRNLFRFPSCSKIECICSAHVKGNNVSSYFSSSSVQSALLFFALIRRGFLFTEFSFFDLSCMHAYMFTRTRSTASCRSNEWTNRAGEYAQQVRSLWFLLMCIAFHLAWLLRSCSLRVCQWFCLTLVYAKGNRSIAHTNTARMAGKKEGFKNPRTKQTFCKLYWSKCCSVAIVIISVRRCVLVLFRNFLFFIHTFE